MSAAALWLTGLSLGWAAESGFSYVHLIGVPLFIFLALALTAWRSFRRETDLPIADPLFTHREAMLRFVPALLLTGFLVGQAPALIYLARLTHPLVVGDAGLQFVGLWQRMVDLVVLDFASLIEFSRHSPDNPAFSSLDFRSPINFVIYLVGLYLLIRRFLFPLTGRGRLGALFYLSLIAALCALHILTERSTLAHWSAPRFLAPIYLATSVGLGFLACELARPIERLFGALSPTRSRSVIATAGLIILLSFLHWGPLWLRLESHTMNLRTGHRAEVHTVVDGLRERGVERVQVLRVTSYTMLGQEFCFASGMKIRFNRSALLGDRLEGHLDESRFHGEVFYLVHARDNSEISPYPFLGANEPGEPFRFAESERIGSFLLFPPREAKPGSVESAADLQKIRVH
jgi:hypothetical protein